MKKVHLLVWGLLLLSLTASADDYPTDHPKLISHELPNPGWGAKDIPMGRGLGDEVFGPYGLGVLGTEFS